MTVNDAARRLGVSTQTVRDLDAVLEPERVGATGIRVYDAGRVDRLVSVRRAERAVRIKKAMP